MQNTIKTKEDARTCAIQWQKWFSTRNLSYGEVLEYQHYFSKLGEQFNLTEEFKENGII